MIIPIWELERDAIIEALRECGWNRTRAADGLDVSIRSLRLKIRQYQAQGFDIPEAGGRSQYGSYEKPKNERPPAIKNSRTPEVL